MPVTQATATGGLASEYMARTCRPRSHIPPTSISSSSGTAPRLMARPILFTSGADCTATAPCRDSAHHTRSIPARSDGISLPA